MKSLFNWALRLTVKFALFIFYRKIHLEGKEFLPRRKAVIIVANHQNALIDPLIVATQTNLKPHFLTRASAFKNPIANRLLRFIRMIPVYRVRDGKHNMDKNNETFDQSISILSQLGSILIFAEGGHSHERNIRSLKKGFTRIAFQTLERFPELDLIILPVGINYSNHSHSGADVGIWIGKEIPVKPYLHNHDQLMRVTQEALKPLVTQIPEENYHNYLQALIDRSISLSNPSQVKIALEKDHLKPVSPRHEGVLWSKKLFRLIHWPLWLLWKRIQPTIEDHVFYATFKFVIGLVGYPLMLTLILLLLPQTVGYPYVLLSILTVFSNRSRQGL
ncbi:1-acyl-sn-glycerol-3-phosphate acyltransferase [Mongoliitalea daihaiensis]|nr:1-acyl-sn-glycerol-3-phosphate acyltransferase [Mongoliitalea daihaiensis]